MADFVKVPKINLDDVIAEHILDVMLTKYNSNTTYFHKIISISCGFPSSLINQKIDQLNLNQFPYLFAFFVELNDLGMHYEILEMIRKKVEHEKRPVIIHFMTNDDNCAKIFYRNEHENHFKDMNEQMTDSFASFYINASSKSSDSTDNELLIDEALKSNDPLSVRFLKILKRTENSDQNLILKCASMGNEGQFLAAIDLHFNYQQEGFGFMLYNLMSDVFEGKMSILKAAVVGKNKEIVEFLTNYFAISLEKLPYEHKILIVNRADDDILYLLLNFANFPLPLSLPKNHDGLNRLKSKKQNFHYVIRDGDLLQVKLLQENFNYSKTAYNLENHSALRTALESKQSEVYSYLFSNGFQAGQEEDLDKLINRLSFNVKSKVTTAITSHANENANESIIILASKSTLHNRKIDSMTTKNLHECIKKLFNDLHKIEEAKILLEIAAKCPKLHIIFNFCNDHVPEIKMENKIVDFTDANLNTIFISASRSMKTNGEHYQQVKGEVDITEILSI